MSKMPHLIAVLMVLGLLAGCGKEEEGGGGTGGGTGSGSGSGNIAVQALVNPEYAVVFLKDGSGHAITNADVRINDVPLQYLYSAPLDGAIYIDTTVRYAKGQTYHLVVNAEGYGNADATVTAPNIDSLKITQPTNGAVVEPNTSLSVSWQYYGGTNNGFAWVSFEYPELDTTTFDSDLLSGSVTNYTIPAAALAFSGTALVSVYAGNYAIIQGLPDPDPTDPVNGSFFAVGTQDDVEITVGSGGGGTTSDWQGSAQGVMNGNPVVGAWYYENSTNVMGFQLAETVFIGLLSTWPPQNAVLTDSTHTIFLTISGTLVSSDSISGTWIVSGAMNGQGVWGGRPIEKK